MATKKKGTLKAPNYKIMSDAQIESAMSKMMKRMNPDVKGSSAPRVQRRRIKTI